MAVRAQREALDRFVLDLGRGGVAVRELWLETTSLEQHFLRLTNRIPLDHGLEKPASAAAAKAADSGAQRPQVPAHLREVAAQWEAWSTIRAKTTGGSHPVEDQVNPAQPNRITWYASTGWTKPYPGDSRVLAPNEVPCRDNPPQDLGD